MTHGVSVYDARNYRSMTHTFQAVDNYLSIISFYFQSVRKTVSGKNKTYFNHSLTKYREGFDKNDC